MAVRRFLPDVERTRRRVGGVFVVLGVSSIAALGGAAMGPGRVSGTALVLLALAGAFVAWGLHLVLRPPVVIEVDLDDRTFVVLRNGSKSAAGTLDSLGPLAVKLRSRFVGSSDKGRTVTEYVVHAAAHSKIELFVLASPGKARQKMESLARVWGLSCRSLGGVVRTADALDQPLHERLRGAREALVAAPLRPEWGLRIEPQPPGYAILSTRRSWAPLVQGAMFLLPALLVVGISPLRILLSTIRDAGGDLLGQILAGLLVVVILSLLWKVGLGVRDTFFPGTVRITERGVAYRGSRMAFDQIEEVLAGIPLEVVGDRRILRLAASFCPPAATAALAHELQRLILEVAARTSP